MNKAVEKQINQIYATIYNQVFNKQNLAAMTTGNMSAAKQALLMLQNSDKYEEFAKKFALALAKAGLNNQKGTWRKFYQAAQKIHYIGLPQTYQQYEMENLSAAIKHNFKMIKSIPSKMMEIFEHKYTSTLVEEVVKGKLPRGSFARELASHGKKQANVIARTETAKLQTAITEYRATKLGSVAYIWLSSNDRRTRPSHKAMNGVVVFWRQDSEKPLLDNMRGNAGEFPNCRCDAEPIVDINDLTKTVYKVYDYRNDTLITMYRSKLIDALQKGSL